VSDEETAAELIALALAGDKTLSIQALLLAQNPARSAEVTDSLAKTVRKHAMQVDIHLLAELNAPRFGLDTRTYSSVLLYVRAYVALNVHQVQLVTRYWQQQGLSKTQQLYVIASVIHLLTALAAHWEKALWATATRT
jgi:hypothetical protein